MRKSVLLVCLVLMMGLVATNALAQRITGSISGQVLDPQKAAVPGAKVTIANEAIGYKLELRTSSDGTFDVLDLRPAVYKVTIEAQGFKTYVTTLTVEVGRAASLSANLELGAAATVVTVEGTALTVDTVKHTVQGVVTGDRIDQLPLNGRNFLDLAQLEPGVQVVDGGTFDPTKNQFVGVSIGGRSGRVTRIQVDGVDITDETVGTTVANISNESIQEFGVSQASLDPSTDLTSSGAVNIITRSGTNAIHGSGFGFFRNQKLAADQRLNKAVPSAEKPPFDRQIVGGRAGGPFFKDKLFWNVDYEHNNQDAQRFTNVPEFPQFSGAFSVPLDETLASGRGDWVISSRIKAFYRFQHNNNFGVTGFGGRDLAAFGNRNNTNIHVGGIDFAGGRWTHAGRFSYLNFNNVVDAANDAAGTPRTIDPQGRPVLIRILGVLQDVGPDLLAPQQTFQDNKQSKYDGSVIWGHHTLSFGTEWNRIDQFVFASFFGNAPRLRARRNTTTRAFARTNPFSPQGELDPLNYPVEQIVLGNGLGFFSEKPALGFPFGGTTNHRLGFYLHDSWKATRDLTLNFGLRYNWNSALSNHDLERTPVLGLFDPGLVGRPRRDADDFAPQAGFAWNVLGNGKTVIRGGAGIFYETNIFNNLLFDRVLQIPPGIGNDTPVINSGFPFLLDPETGAVIFNFSTQCTGLPGGNCFAGIGQALGSVIPFGLQAQQLLQTRSAALSANWPPPGVPPLFDQILDTEGSVLDTHYKTPYGIQMNVGVQREIKPSLVLSVDYVHNRGVHFNLTRDRNRLGAANTLHVPTAAQSVALTLQACGVSTIDAGLVNCPGGPVSLTNRRISGRPLGISDFTRLRAATSADPSVSLGAGAGVDGFAFSGMNRNFRGIGIIEPAGLSRYQALQVRLRGDIGSWRAIKRLSTNITYALGRFESTGVDQDFLSTAVFNDRPTKFFGAANFDRTHQFRFSFLVDLPLGFSVSTGTGIATALANSLFLPATSGGADEIFYSDLDGDGVTEDPLPSTNRGSFSRDVRGNNINNLINKFNSTVAGTLSPPGIALVQAGLFTEAQLRSLGAVITSITPAPAGQADNDSSINTDIRISNRIKVTERLTVEPMVEIFNLFNIANYTSFSSSLDGNPGNANGTTATTRPTRVGSGSGAFAPGTMRAFQFGIRVSF